MCSPVPSRIVTSMSFRCTIMEKRRLASCMVAVGVLAVAACGTTAGKATARPAFADRLQPLIEQALKANAIPGAVVLIDKGGEGRWLQTFGTATVGATSAVAGR